MKEIHKSNECGRDDISGEVQDTKELQDGTCNLYRVRLMSTLLVDVFVTAEDPSKARGKAAYWKCDGISGKRDVSDYSWFDEDGQPHEEEGDGELVWEIVAEEEFHEDREVIELHGDVDGGIDHCVNLIELEQNRVYFANDETAPDC